VNEQGIAAHSPSWDGYDPQMLGWNYTAFTNPHQK
jgi:hypothetical protein